MDITIFMVTVGEPVTFEALESIKMYADNKRYKIMIWYDACGRGVNLDFYNRLKEYTDDVILSTQNQGLPKIFGYAMLYTDTPYLFLTGSDTVFNPNFLSDMLEPFSTMDNVGVVGECGRDLPDKYTVCKNEDIIPDLAILIKKKVINEVGATSPSFKLYGQEFSEWCNRVIADGRWQVISCTGTGVHKDDPSDGKAKIEDLIDVYGLNVGLVLRLKDKGYKGYDWWSNDL